MLKSSCQINVNRYLLPKIRPLQTQTQAKPQLNYRGTEVVPIFRKAINFAERPALRDSWGTYTYANIVLGAKELAKDVTSQVGGKSNERVLFLCPNDANYVITQWALWMSGQIVVPLSPLHPQNMLEYFSNDSNCKLLITTPEYAELMHRVAKNTSKKLYVLDDKLRQNAASKTTEKSSDLESGLSSDFYNRQNAMIVYTSGTTGNPKGAVLSHKNLVTQMHLLGEAWKWTQNDTILHVLPLHHIHGIVNALMCPLYVGAKCNMLAKYDSNTVWTYLLGVTANPEDRKITVFMGVPTIYAKLIQEYERVFVSDSKMTDYIKATLKSKVRLMVSGSAPLPATMYERWLEISGHRLLERYGMTEIGMCFSQLFDSDREAGYVGVPLPGVSVRLAQKHDDDDSDYSVLLDCTNNNGQIEIKQPDKDVTGELLVKGDSVFKEYFNKPGITQAEFTVDGWFRTGDVCQYSAEKKLFKMLGRTSVDIINSRGYKLSALEIETHLLEHPAVSDCAVVGLEHETWGEKVVACVVPKPGGESISDELKSWAGSKMASYSVPEEYVIMESIPKNVMGKVNKKELIKSLKPPAV